MLQRGALLKETCQVRFSTMILTVPESQSLLYMCMSLGFNAKGLGLPKDTKPINTLLRQDRFLYTLILLILQLVEALIPEAPRGQEIT